MKKTIDSNTHVATVPFGNPPIPLVVTPLADLFHDVQIHISHTQIGMAIDARQGNEEWKTVEIQRYKEYDAGPSVKAYKTCIDPSRQEKEYLDLIRSRGIKFTLVKDKG